MKMLVAGDFCPQDRVQALFEKGLYADVLEDIKSQTTEADYSIVNLECPIVTNLKEKISKKGPNHHCGPSVISALKYAGFDGVTLANNHFRDFGTIGCEETLSALDAAAIDHVGGGMNLALAQEVLYRQLKGKRLAIVNICENEFSIATGERAGAAPLDLVQNYYQITEARKNADHVAVIVHGGHELYQLPSMRMKKTYRWFIDLGADVVVNHHQHCYTGYETYNEKLIFYGLGNFCFDSPRRRNHIWNEGYMVLLTFDKTIDFCIIPYKQCDAYPRVSLLTGKEKDVFLERIHSYNEIIESDFLLNKAANEYYNSCKRDMEVELGNLSDYKLIRGLKRKHFMSSSISEHKRNQLIDYIFCEAHRDKVEYCLKNK